MPTFLITLFRNPKLMLYIILAGISAYFVYNYVAMNWENDSLKQNLAKEKAKVDALVKDLEDTVNECNTRTTEMSELHKRDIARQKQLKPICVDSAKVREAQQVSASAVTKEYDANAKCLVDNMGKTDGKCKAGKWVIL